MTTVYEPTVGVAAQDVAYESPPEWINDPDYLLAELAGATLERLEDALTPSTAATSSTVRKWWSEWLCQSGGLWVAGEMFGAIGGVPYLMAPAYAAMEDALTDTDYQPAASTWSYNCRKIAGSASWSLHAYGLAVDVDPTLNPYSKGDPYSGAFKPNDVEAVLSIRTVRDDRQVFTWGGNWSTPDRMHFQCDVPPEALADGVVYEGAPTPPPTQPPPGGNEIVFEVSRVLVSRTTNARHPDVRIAQSLLAGFSPTSPGTIDGIAGTKFDASAKAWQRSEGLTADGAIGSKSWPRLEDA